MWVLIPAFTHGLGFLTRLDRVPAAPAQPGVPNCTMHWRDAKLSNFDYAEHRTFRQRYFKYSKYAKPGGPILFYCGNEANVELYVNATGLMWERAAELGALLVFAEHRYYGRSLPFGAQSSANASTLRWLTMEQALADYATLIYELKAEMGTPNVPVVALGGSYGGMLAAWLRMHYPSAVVGAIAASAPVLAFDGLGGRTFDGNSFWRVVTADGSAAAGSVVDCVPGVRASWPGLFDWSETAAGRDLLRSKFRLCLPLAPSDGPRLASWLLNVWDTLAMGNFPYASNYLIFQQTQDPTVLLPPWPFRAACRAFDGAKPTDSIDSLLARMAVAAGLFYNASGREQCYELPDDPSFDGIWDYQWCTERLPQETYFTLDGVHDMFWSRPDNKTAVAEHCAKKYNVSARGVTWVASSSAFTTASSSSNIVFSNGEYDPWRSGGVTTNLSSTLIALEVEQGAHHLDLMFSNPADPPSVRSVRNAEIAQIRRWIAKP